MIIPLVGQASCQGMSSAWGHWALQGWACQQSGEGSREEPFGGATQTEEAERQQAFPRSTHSRKAAGAWY